MANPAPLLPGTRIVNGRQYKNGNRDKGQCPVSSCNFGKPVGQSRGQIFDHLRNDHKVKLPVHGPAYKKVPGGPREQPGKGTNAWNADCLKVFIEWAKENGMPHDGGHLLFRSALPNGFMNTRAATASHSTRAGNRPTAKPMENAIGDATEEQDDEDGEEEDEPLDDGDYDYGANVNKTLSKVISQLRADSRSLSLSLADLGKILDKGLHHQLIDHFVSTEANHLRDNSAYRCFLLVTIIDFVHYRAYRAYELNGHLAVQTRTFKIWLGMLSRAQQEERHHLQYVTWAGKARAEDGFFDVMYGFHIQALAVNDPYHFAKLDLKAVVSELGDEKEAKFATSPEHDIDALRSENPALLSAAVKNVMTVWLADYDRGYIQTFFQHLDWRIDIEKKLAKENSRAKGPCKIYALEDGGSLED